MKTETRGRKTRYKKEFAEQGRKLCLMGYTDKQLGDFFGVSEQTINAWKKAHPLFLESIKAGKDFADCRVVESLYEKTKEKIVKLKKPVSVSDGHGMGSHVEQHPQETFIPADSTACIFWLKNRQPKLWREKQDIEITGELDVKLTPAERKAKIDELIKKQGRK